MPTVFAVFLCKKDRLMSILFFPDIESVNFSHDILPQLYKVNKPNRRMRY